MSPYFLALLFSLPVVVVSLIGGWLPHVINFTHAKTQMFMALVSGFMIGVAMLHLLPHGIEQLASVYEESAVKLGVICLVGGIVIMFATLRLLSFHDHEPVSTSKDSQLTIHTGHVTWLTVVAGLSVHTLIEGFAVGSSLGLEQGVDLDHHAEEGEYAWSLTFAVVLAIVLHKPLDALAVVGIMKHSGFQKKVLWLTNVGFALICPVGALLLLFFLREILHDYEYVLGFVLSVISGAFLCIALADLLPEAFRHRHDRVKIFIAFLCGVLLIFLFGLFTPEAH